MEEKIVKETIKTWDNIFIQREWGKYPPIPLVRFIAKNFYSFQNRKKIKILEIGSGPGPNLWYMAREGFTVFGIDGSERACRLAIERLKKENLQSNIGSIMVGDYHEQLNLLEDNFFDAIIDVESLCCNPFKRAISIIKTCFDKLKPAGKMLSITFADGTYGLDGNEADYHALLPKIGPMANQGLTRYTTRDDIDKLYKTANNKIISVQRQDLLLNPDSNNGEKVKEWIIEIEKN